MLRSTSRRSSGVYTESIPFLRTYQISRVKKKMRIDIIPLSGFFYNIFFLDNIIVRLLHSNRQYIRRFRG